SVRGQEGDRRTRTAAEGPDAAASRRAGPSGRRRNAMATILDSVRSLVTPDLLAQAATALGEPQSNVSRGIGAAAPTILAGLLAKSNDTGIMRQVMDLLGSANLDSNLLRNLGTMLSEGGPSTRSPLADLAQQFLSVLFGPQTGSVANTIGGQAGLKPQSASSLLSLAAPLVMSVLGGLVKREGLNVAGLARLLDSQRDSVLKETPAGLMSLLGLGGSPRLPVGERMEIPARPRASWLPAAALAGLGAPAGPAAWSRA